MTDYQGEERREGPAGWHLDKTLSVGNAITMAVVIATMIWYEAGQDLKISKNAIDIDHARTTFQQRAQTIERTQRDAEQRATRTVERIEAKLDKIFDYVRSTPR